VGQGTSKYANPHINALMDQRTDARRLLAQAQRIESDVHCFLKLVDEGRALPRAAAIAAYEKAVDLYRGDLPDRLDVPAYRLGCRPMRGNPARRKLRCNVLSDQVAVPSVRRFGSRCAVATIRARALSW
jgi:hypothetical protein